MTDKEVMTRLFRAIYPKMSDEEIERGVSGLKPYYDTLDGFGFPGDKSMAAVTLSLSYIIGYNLLRQEGWYEKVSELISDDDVTLTIDKLCELAADLDDESDPEEENG